MIPPKRFDISPPLCGVLSRSRYVQIFFKNHCTSAQFNRLIIIYDNSAIGPYNNEGF